jgi:hypothetical protein
MLVTHENTAVNTVSVESNDFSIEVSPLLYKLMYTHLYVDKEQIVLQELSANALDAHKAAGIPDVPISIILPSKVNPFLIIEDFGTGMTQEFVTSLYTTYGASTKRESNDAVGGFGYGSKSPFSISDSFTVETTYEGKTTTVACYLDGGVPKYTIFSNSDLSRKNGTKITIPVSDETKQIRLRKKVTYLYLLWDTQPNVNGRPIEEAIPEVVSSVLYKDESCIIVNSSAYEHMPNYSSYRPLEYIAVGPFVYQIPAQTMQIIYNTTKFKELMHIRTNEGTVNAVLRFNIGEIRLSPSRETIIDCTENTTAITNRLKELYKDVTSSLVTEGYQLYLKFIRLVGKEGIFANNKLQLINPKVVDKFVSDNIKPGCTFYEVTYLKSRYFNNPSAFLADIHLATEKELDEIEEFDFITQYRYNYETIRANNYRRPVLHMAAAGRLKNAGILRAAAKILEENYNIKDTIALNYTSSNNRLTRSEVSSSGSYNNRHDLIIAVTLDKEEKDVAEALRGYCNKSVSHTILHISAKDEAQHKDILDTLVNPYMSLMSDESIKTNEWIDTYQTIYKERIRQSRKNRTSSPSTSTNTRKSVDSDIVIAHSYPICSDLCVKPIYKDKVSAVLFNSAVKHVLVIVYNGKEEIPKPHYDLRRLDSLMNSVRIVAITKSKAGTKAGKELIRHLEDSYNTVVCHTYVNSALTEMLRSTPDIYADMVRVRRGHLVSRLLFDSCSEQSYNIIEMLYPELAPLQDTADVSDIIYSIGEAQNLTRTELYEKIDKDSLKSLLYIRHLHQYHRSSMDSKLFISTCYNEFTEDTKQKLTQILTVHQLLEEKSDDSLHKD